LQLKKLKINWESQINENHRKRIKRSYQGSNP